MDGFDDATWQALGLVLTLLGLGVSAAVWTRRGAASGLRAVAWSLLPLAAGLTGVLRLVWDIGEAVARWVTRLVFSPVVWLGLVVAMVAVALFLVSGFLRSRGRHSRSVTPATTRRTPRPARVQSPPAGSGPHLAASGDDMSDIEELLRKHGIT